MPLHASTLLALSYRGAQRLKEEYWPSMQRSHFDISLKWVCENHAKHLEASFVMPTIGHYSTHDSDILQATRTSEWDRWYVGNGEGLVELMTWDKFPNQKVKSRHLLEFDMSQNQPEFDWLTLYRESDDPQVEPVATWQPSPDQEDEQEFDPKHHRTFEEMQHAFDVERMVGDEEATSKRQLRQKRRYTRDAAFRIFTADVLQASWGNPFRFKSFRFKSQLY